MRAHARQVHTIGDGMTVAIKKPQQTPAQQTQDQPPGNGVKAVALARLPEARAAFTTHEPRAVEGGGARSGAHASNGGGPFKTSSPEKSGGEGGDEKRSSEGAVRAVAAQQRRRGGWGKGDWERNNDNNRADIGADRVRSKRGGRGASFVLHVQGNFGAGKKELALGLVSFLFGNEPTKREGASADTEAQNAPKMRQTPGALVVGDWATQALMQSFEQALSDRDTGPCQIQTLQETPSEKATRDDPDELVVFLDTPPDLCLQRLRGSEPSRKLAQSDFPEKLRRVDDLLFAKVVESMLVTCGEGECEYSAADKAGRVLVLDWREVGRPGDVLNMVRGALEGAYDLPQVMRVPATVGIPSDAFVVTLDQLVEMGRGLSEGQDVLITDPRATPGSFLQVTASLLEGAYALGLQADLTIADAETDGVVPKIYVFRPASREPPPGMSCSADEWALAGEAFKRLVLHLLSRLRSVVLVDPA